MKPIRVSLKKDSYKIHVGPVVPAILRAVKQLRLKPSRVFLVTTSGVLKAGYPKKVARLLKKLRVPVHVVTIPNGEAQKNIQTLTRLYRDALKFGLDRRGLVVAVGGGVVTDMAGFLAASYMRGLPYISVPTTLLGMVDAAIGGKTGIDLAEGKNLVGAFWQPRLVWIDPAVLKTLPKREWKTGFAEIVKYGVIKDRSLFHWLEDKIRRNSDVQSWSQSDLKKVIHRCAQIKARVVSQDEKETPLKGGREILNFGHTAGHALEAATRYGRMTHGEAISVGMLAAGSIAFQMKMWSVGEQFRLLSLFHLLGLPVKCPKLTQKEKNLFWTSLRKDKKNVAGQLRFVLPVQLGHVLVKSGVPLSLVQKAMASVGF